MKLRLAVALKTKARQKVAADYLKQLREKATIKLDGQLAAAVEAAKVAQEEATTENAPLLGEDAPATAPVTAPVVAPALP